MRNELEKEYFQAAQGWYIDRYALKSIEANRYLLCSIVLGLVTICLGIAIITILPLKQLEPIIVRQNSVTHETWIERASNKYNPINEAEIKADIVRYILSRESYSAYDIKERFKSVMLLSDEREKRTYGNFQSNDNKDAPINKLAKEGRRTIHIEDIIFLDKAGRTEDTMIKTKSENLAKVDFTATTEKTGNEKKVEHLVATISWSYNGTPQDEEEAWGNWHGFTVHYYRVDQRII